MIRVTVWNEFIHENAQPFVAELYPGGIHETLKALLQEDDFVITTSYLEKDDYQGLSPALLADTDVLIWWSHCRQEDLTDETARRVTARVRAGMGFIVLHAGRNAKPFKMMMGTRCSAVWRDWNEKTYVWNTCPAHPIAAGVPEVFALEGEEMYGEYFDIPRPDDVVFISWFAGGNVFRGGVTFTYGLGKIFYFHPGHERCRSLYNEHVVRILKNAVRWAQPVPEKDIDGGVFQSPLEPIADLEKRS
ncbi:MAG: ThuA domain-containing protein [Clostridia bacterium]|nr:ThuA domain-containing protein [Clostridia bacterium]